MRPEARVPGMFWFYGDKFIPELKGIAEAMQKYGAKIAVQLDDFRKVLSNPSFFNIQPK